MQFSQPLANAARAYLEAKGSALSHVVHHARYGPHAGPRAPLLVEIKAVDGAYPLAGTVTLEGGMPLAEALAGGGAVADRGLLDRLGIEIGESVRVGAALIPLRAVLEREPDRLGGGFALGPRLMTGHAALEETGLVQPGALIRHRYRALIPDGATLAEWAAALDAAFPDAGWRQRDARDANPRSGASSTASASSSRWPGSPHCWWVELASRAPSRATCTASCTPSRRSSASAPRAPRCSAAFLMQLGVLGLGASARRW